MERAVRLDSTYDVDLLTRDMERALADGVSHSNRTWRHGDGWKTVALHSVDGRTDPDALRWAGWDANYRPTPILERCPYFQMIIAAFECPIYRVRLSNLAAGCSINPHRDPGDSWAVGKVRLHIPIVTNDDVWFFIDDQRVIMREGELWYADVSPLHSVHNRGDRDRVHLMLDVGVNAWLRREFPPESLLTRVGNFKERSLYVSKERLWSWRRRSGLTRLRDRAGRLLDRRSAETDTKAASAPVPTPTPTAQAVARGDRPMAPSDERAAGTPDRRATPRRSQPVVEAR